jgi:dimethylhistidine N-methyltransferase
MGEWVSKQGLEQSTFAKHVEEGLSAKEKKISSMYLYDDEGSRLFEEIMDLPEYYPSRCELEILKKYKRTLLELTCIGTEIYLVDLGAGNGLKTMVLLHHFSGRTNFKYVPIDISKSALTDLENNLKQKYSHVPFECIHGEYMESLRNIKSREGVRKLVLFLGSTIGNFTFREAMHFLSDLHDSLNKDDLVLLGFDIMKDPNVIRSAYNDSRGVTAKFNFNLLVRVNRELGANFDLNNFLFYPTYDPSTGEMKSYLVSKTEQVVYFKALNRSFQFHTWEAIHTECSNKYDVKMIEELAVRTNFEIEENFYDSKKYFLDSLWKVR